MENFPIPDEYFSAPIEDLFQLLAEALAKFVKKLNRYSADQKPM